MKHKCFAAVVLAAALWLTGCGGAAAPAAPASSGAASQSTADTAVQTAQKDRITEQFTLEKTIRNDHNITYRLNIHVPQLVCDGPEAAYINYELAAMYAADFREYADSPEIEPQQDEGRPDTYINWDAYWYGDCVSLVMFRYDGGSDPGYSRGWCFDFATEKQVSVAEMLQRMGLDPDAVQQQMLREAMQTFDRRMAQGGYYEGLLSGGNLASMRMNTLENNQLDDLCLLLPEQNRLVLRGGCSSTAGSGWRQLDVEIPLQAADPQPQTVLTDTYGSASVQLEGTQGTITLRRTPETAAWDADYGIRLEQDRTYPMARMKRVFDEVFDKTEFRVNAYPSTPTQMGLVFCDELGMLYIDDRTGGRGKMPELIRYDQIASYEEYLDETPAKEPGQEPTLNGGGLKLKLVQPRSITEAQTQRGMRPHPYIKQELVICFSKRDRREIGYAHIARQHLDHIFGVHDNETSLFGRRMSKAEERELKGQVGMISAMGAVASAAMKGGQLSEQEKARFVENINLANDAQTGGMAVYSRRADEAFAKVQ